MTSASLKDKIPPHNMEAEQATLGALLLDWDAVSSVLSYLRPDRFYSSQNQIIFSAMLGVEGYRKKKLKSIFGSLVTNTRNSLQTNRSKRNVL